jgi:hypothetical protein
MSDIVVTETLSQAVERQAREIERLRSAANRGGHLAVANAEIERLSAQVAAMKGYIHKAHERDGAEIERLRNPEPCWWIHTDSDFYESQCGGSFQFTDGGPYDNAFTHCPFCGKPLMVGVQEEDGDE